jgi:hypothetical protein
MDISMLELRSGVPDLFAAYKSMGRITLICVHVCIIANCMAQFLQKSG